MNGTYAVEWQQRKNIKIAKDNSFKAKKADPFSF